MTDLLLFAAPFLFNVSHIKIKFLTLRSLEATRFLGDIVNATVKLF